MAKPTYRLYESYYSGGGDISNSILLTGGANGFRGVDMQHENTFKATGSGLDYHLGRPTDGVITTLEVFDDDGAKAYTLTNLNVDVGLIAGASLGQFISNVIVNISARGYTFIGTAGDDNNLYTSFGNDIVKGGAGDDFIGGGKGQDQLWGGLGDDTFGFVTGYGKDRIMDFDADGSDGHQDLISSVIPDPSDITKSGKNTVIDFGDGDVLTLVGINPVDIDTSDFA